MTTIKAAGTLLTASVTDRILSYLLLPFGEEGRTSAGRVTASAGSVTIPAGHRVVANMEHDRKSPVATSTVIEETPAGLTASFRVLPTTAGNDLLIEASEGVRTGISVEIDNPVIRDGQLLAGTLSGAGFVTTPAFPSAQLVAADAGDLPDELPADTTSTAETVDEIVVEGVTYVRKTTSTYTTETARKDGEPLDEEPTDTPETDPEEEPPVTAALRQAAPAALLARQGQRTPTQKPERTVKDVSRILATYAATRDPRVLADLGDDPRDAGVLFAALNDIKYDGAGAPGNNMHQPTWLGELWSGRDYVRKIVDLFGHDDLTSLEMKGWQWDVEPVMAAWAGNKTAVPSNTPTTKSVPGVATRYAGAHDHAREYRDFPNPEYWEGYFRAMTKSYKKLTDVATAATVVAAATPVTSGSVPVGAAPGLVKVVDGVLSMIDFTSASFALLAPDLWRDVILTPQDKALEYLSSAMGLEEGSLDGFRLLPWSGLAAGSVLVGAREAATVHELPGSPIRVEGLDMVKGGIDTGLFGYHGTMINDARGLALVDGPVAG